MASTVSKHVQEVKWSFVVREIFHPRSNKGKAITVLAGSIRSGGQDDPIGRSVRVFIGGLVSGQGTIISRFRFDASLSDQSAYVYEGSPINSDDLGKEIVLVSE
jgi:hypothetical protein